jgi:hypothetical protein
MMNDELSTLEASTTQQAGVIDFQQHEIQLLGQKIKTLENKLATDASKASTYESRFSELRQNGESFLLELERVRNNFELFGSQTEQMYETQMHWLMSARSKQALASSSKAKSHFKKLKYSTEIALKQFEKQLASEAKASREQLRGLINEESSNWASKFELQTTEAENRRAILKLEVSSQIEQLEKKILAQKTEYTNYKEKKEQEDHQFKQSFVGLLKATEQRFSSNVEEAKQHWSSQLTEATHNIDLKLTAVEKSLTVQSSRQLQKSKELGALLEEQSLQIMQERDKRLNLEETVQANQRVLEEKLKETEKNILLLVEEKTKVRAAPAFLTGRLGARTTA